jgi:uncharacterized protein
MQRRPGVLLDTNILISGLVFPKGNEHQILTMAEEEKITLVLPEPVLIEAREVMSEKFPGFETLLELFVNRVGFESVDVKDISARLEVNKVRDKKDAPIFAAAAISRSDYVITGDGTLRSDLANSPEISAKVCSSKEFLQLK